MRLPFFNKQKSDQGLIGIDFQAEHIAIAQIVHGDKPVLKQCRFETLETNQSETTSSTSNDVVAILSKTAKSFPSKKFFCNTSIDHEHYELLLIDAPNVEQTELKQAVRWRIKDQLPYHIDDAVVDVFEIPGQPSSRAKLMYVVATQNQVIDERAEQIKKAGLKLQSIDIYELAQRNIAAILPEDKDGVVVLRLKKKSGLLTITRNGTLFLTREITFGSDRLGEVLAANSTTSAQHDMTDEDIELSIDDVHDADVVVSESLESEQEEMAPTLNDVVEQNTNNKVELSDESKLIIDEVVLEIQRSLDYYVSHFNQRAVTKIVFAPVLYEMDAIVNYIHDMLGINTEVLDFNRYLTVSTPLEQAMQSYCFDAIGLALRYESVQG